MCSRLDGRLSEEALDLVVERPLVLDQPVGRLARLLQEAAIAAQAREEQIGQPRLARPEQLSLAADLQVALGELETVVRSDERLQPRARRVGQLLLRA